MWITPYKINQNKQQSPTPFKTNIKIWKKNLKIEFKKQIVKDQNISVFIARLKFQGLYIYI